MNQLRAGLVFAIAFPLTCQAQFEVSVPCSAATSTQYVPSYGQVRVGRDSVSPYIEHYFYYHQSSRLADFRARAASTMELHHVFYNYNDAVWGLTPVGSAIGFLQTNVPAGYIDTEIGNSPDEKNLGVGSADARLLEPGVLYYFSHRTDPGRGVYSITKIYTSRGVRIPSMCGDALCVYGCSNDNRYYQLPFAWRFWAPGCQRYWHQWNTSTSAACI